MSKLAPTALAKFLLFGFAAAVLVYLLANADALDVVVLQFVFLPWFVGPAAIARLLVARSPSKAEAWLHLAVEAGAIASTAWLWASLYLNPDAQNGIAMILFPIAQFAAVLCFAALSLFVKAMRRLAGSSAR